MNFLEKELYSAEGAVKVSDLRKHDICMSIRAVQDYDLNLIHYDYNTTHHIF